MILYLYYIIINIIFSFSLGVIISYLFKINRYHGLNSKDVIKKIYKKGNKCYKLYIKRVKCSFLSSHD